MMAAPSIAVRRQSFVVDLTDERAASPTSHRTLFTPRHARKRSSTYTCPARTSEWRRGTVNTPGGWSYHAKGIWITLPGEQNPSISLVGSSNYTKRSYRLDLEANTLIVTQNADLQRRLGEEEKWLQEYASPMSLDDYARTERRVGLHVRLAMWIVTLVGGAL